MPFYWPIPEHFISDIGQEDHIVNDTANQITSGSTQHCTGRCYLAGLVKCTGLHRGGGEREGGVLVYVTRLELGGDGACAGYGGWLGSTA